MACVVLLVVRRGIAVTFVVLRGEITDCIAKELVNLLNEKKNYELF